MRRKVREGEEGEAGGDEEGRQAGEEQKENAAG